MSAYYSENDAKAAAWLRELIAADVIIPGVVDERDIRDIAPSDLAGFAQCHFFAGIGGWPYALRLAGWPDTRPVWTGSCPCQPFSQAGQRKGTLDERHLWPAWHWLINAVRPPILFGEQVASPDGLEWLDLIRADLEGSSYEVEYADLCAAGIGAPHIRQRLFWVADSLSERRKGIGLYLQSGTSRFDESEVGGICQVSDRVGDSLCPRLPQRVGDRCVQPEAVVPSARQASIGAGDAIHSERLAYTDGLASGQGGTFDTWRYPRGDEGQIAGLGGSELFVRLGNPGCPRTGRNTGAAANPIPTGAREGDSDRQYAAHGIESSGSVRQIGNPDPVGFWTECIWIACADGKARPTQPGIEPLVAGLPKGVGRMRDSSLPFDPNNTAQARTMRLRGYGNAIVPQLAAQFIGAYLDTLGE